MIQRWDLVKLVGKSGAKCVMGVHLRSWREQQKTKRRVISMMLTCSMCDGVGKMEGPEICPDCKGKGKVRSRKIPSLPPGPIFEPVAAAVAMPILEPIIHVEETISVPIGDGSRISVSMDQIKKQLQQDLFRSAMLPGSLFDRRG